MSSVPKVNPRLIWIAACLATGLLIPRGNDGGIIFAIVLLVLTFPSGLLGYLCFSGLYGFAGNALGWQNAQMSSLENATYYIALGFMLVIPGYLQWFVLIPRIKKAVKGIKGNGV